MFEWRFKFFHCTETLQIESEGENVCSHCDGISRENWERCDENERVFFVENKIDKHGEKR